MASKPSLSLAMIVRCCSSFTSAESAAEDGQQLGLEQSPRRRARVQRVHDDARGPAFGKRVLLVVDEAALQRKGEQHAQHAPAR